MDIQFCLKLACAAQDILQLMGNHGFNGGAAWSKVLSWVKDLRLFYKDFTDRGSHGQSQVCVDIDLADAPFGSFTQHIFWDTLCAWNGAAVLVTNSLGTLEDPWSTNG